MIICVLWIGLKRMEIREPLTRRSSAPNFRYSGAGFHSLSSYAFAETIPSDFTVIVESMALNGQMAKYVGAAALIGAIVGVGSTAGGRQSAADAIQSVSAATDMRSRPPQPGDYWGGCNDARAAGTAPIYRGEPGYREGMDGDGDGVACEPYRGM